MTCEVNRADRYDLTDKDADTLHALALVPRDARLDILLGLDADHVRRLFIEFMGLANSVVANGSAVARYVLVDEGKLSRERADQLNMPTISGALLGVKLANAAGQARTCKGCAYRFATPANQSPVTTAAALAAERGQFMCHEALDGDGEPTKVCRGHARALRFADIERKA